MSGTDSNTKFFVSLQRDYKPSRGTWRRVSTICTITNRSHACHRERSLVGGALLIDLINA